MKPISVDVKEIIFKVYTYFDKICKGEVENIKRNESDFQLITRLKEITGLSKTSLYEIINTGEAGSIENLKSRFEPAKREAQARKTNLSDAQLYQIREMLYNFHETEGKLATLRKLCEKVELEMDLKMSVFSMRMIIRKLGFRFKKASNNRVQLVEKAEIVQKRKEYLMKLAAYRALGRPISFIDETYVHTNYSTFKAWQDETSGGFKSKIGKGKRFIIGTKTLQLAGNFCFHFDFIFSSLWK